MTQSKQEHGSEEPLRDSAGRSDDPSSTRPATTGSGCGVPRRRQRLGESPTRFPELVPLARRLEALRLERGLTQRALAARASISGNHYQEIAYARANPTITVMIRLAEALNVSMADLFDPVGTAKSERRRSVLIGDLEALVVAHGQLLNTVKRVARDEHAMAHADLANSPQQQSMHRHLTAEGGGAE